ncbi:hypothetical protein [Deinococcus sp. NW-56]|uniref:hypothetical protein n=1 Tax=Deinococcus sp. NW-56 TaxID=2080419 RepID=UPI000CF43B0A|nr:hypothetical protein [Deinococcus sp. NW-56]
MTSLPPLFLWKSGWHAARGPYHDPQQLRTDADHAARQYPGETVYVMGPYSTVQVPPPEPLWDTDAALREAFWAQIEGALTAPAELEQIA